MEIPESIHDANKTLYKQLALLAEKSKECNPEILPEISKTMVLILIYLRFVAD